MSPVEIKVAMLRVGVSQADIARKCNVHRSMIGHIIHGRAVAAHIHNAIATAINIPAKQIWPDYYETRQAV